MSFDELFSKCSAFNFNYTLNVFAPVEWYFLFD